MVPYAGSAVSATYRHHFFLSRPEHTHSRSRHRDFYGPRFYYYGLRHGGGASPASAPLASPLGQAASSSTPNPNNTTAQASILAVESTDGEELALG